jgi:uncharacterized membrane protein
MSWKQVKYAEDFGGCMKQNQTQVLLKIAMIAAVYTALSLLLAPLSFGPLQVRIAEALTLLPVLAIMPVWGLTLGCALTNFLGVLSGANILGFGDVVLGTLATLGAALLSYRYRHVRYHGIPWLSALFPILVNAIVIGGELALILKLPFLSSALYIAGGEALSVIVIGLPLLYRMEKGPFHKYFS